ncbi:MAG: fluoride efflux transporter CrcB [Nitrospirae bacterium]|nr:fluoride efflux transporter CrcB [Candidatus Troglogloeales bacterium]
MRLLLIGLGGFVGSILRYLISRFAQGIAPSNGFPWGTLVVNLVGCLLTGVFIELIADRRIFGPEAYPLLVIGLLGGFTTFSAFSNETVIAFRNGLTAIAVINILASVLFGLFAVCMGRAIVNLVWK